MCLMAAKLNTGWLEDRLKGLLEEKADLGLIWGVVFAENYAEGRERKRIGGDREEGGYALRAIPPSPFVSYAVSFTAHAMTYYRLMLPALQHALCQLECFEDEVFPYKAAEVITVRRLFVSPEYAGCTVLPRTSYYWRHDFLLESNWKDRWGVSWAKGDVWEWKPK